MAEKWLEEIYAYSKYVTKLKELRRICQVNNKLEAMRQWESSCDQLENILNNKTIADEKIRTWIKKIYYEVPKVTDCNKLIDLIEQDVLPLMYYVIAQLGKVDVSDGTRHIISSRSGYLTIYGETDQKYWYSATDPMEEAYDIADRLYTPKNTEYHIWGGGLGYLAFQLSCLSHKSAMIHVYEADREMLDYGQQFGVLDWIPDDKLILHYDPQAEEFLQEINEKKNNYYVSRPDMRYCQGEVFAELRRVYLNSRFWIEEAHMLKHNIACNTRGGQY